MKNKILPLLLAACLLLSLTACGGKNSTLRTRQDGYPRTYAKEREAVMELLEQYGEAERIPMIISKGRLVEAIDRVADYYYYGEMKGVEPHGYGVVLRYNISLDRDAVTFAGEFKKGKPCGYGIAGNGLEICEADQCCFNTFLGNHGFYAEGDGFVYTASTFGKENPDILYIGELKDSQPHGTGKLWSSTQDDELYPTLKKGPLLYEGEFKKGTFTGTGTLYYEDGAVHYKGAFDDNAFHGKGTLYEPDGSVKHKGTFKYGEIVK